MINREQKTVQLYKFLNERDAYGQGRKLVKNLGTDNMFIKFYSSALAGNPGYTDVDYIALSKNRDLGPDDLIEYDNHIYRIIYVVPSRKFNELFIRETNELPEIAKIPTPTGLYVIIEPIGFQSGFTPVEGSNYQRYEFYSIDGTSRGQYNTWENPEGLGYISSSFPPGDYKFRVIAKAPEGSDYEDSDPSEFYNFTIPPYLDTPTNLKFTELSTSNLFKWDEVTGAYSYIIKIKNNDGVIIKELESYDNQYTLLNSFYRLQAGTYKFNVRAFPEICDNNIASLPSDDKEFTVRFG